jgi:hypothetical protein
MRHFVTKGHIYKELTTSMYVAQGIHGLAYGMVLFLSTSDLNVIFGIMSNDK